MPGIDTLNDGSPGRLGSDSEGIGSARAGSDRLSEIPGIETLNDGSPGRLGSDSEGIGSGITGS